MEKVQEQSSRAEEREENKRRKNIGARKESEGATREVGLSNIHSPASASS